MKPSLQDLIWAREVHHAQKIPTAAPELGIHPPGASDTGEVTTVVVDPPERVEEEEDKDTWDTAKALAGFSREEEAVAAELTAAAAKEALA